MINHFPCISIITVVFNDVKNIEKTILSVVNQKYKNIDFIVIDGGSYDGTIDVIKKYENYISTFVSEKDYGIYDAMNKGISYAKGDWIHFLNSGDEFVNSNTLSDVNFSGVEEQVKVLHGDVILSFKRGEIYKKLGYRSDGLPLLYHQGVFVRSLLQKKNLFDLRYRICADYNFLYFLYRTQCTFKYLEFPIVKYDMAGFSAENYLLFYKEKSLIEGGGNFLGYLYFFIKSSLRRLHPGLYDYLNFVWLKITG